MKGKHENTPITDELPTAIESQALTPETKITVFCEDYLAHNPAVKSEHTKELLRIVVRHFDRYLNRPAIVADLTDRTTTAYASHRRSLGRKETTVENELVRLRSLWAYAARLGLVEQAKWKLVRLRPNRAESMARSEIRALFRAAKNAKGMIGDLPRNVYFPALLGVMWDSEERITAVRMVERADIERDARYITFRQRKGGGRPLRWPMRFTTRRAVQKLLAASNRPLPFNVLHIASLYDHWDQILLDAGITPSKRNRPHGIRRSGASHYQAAGGRAQDILDHEDERTTRRHYIDPLIATVRAPANVLFNPLGWADRLRGLFAR
jgi:site-specific recombinase XerD